MLHPIDKQTLCIDMSLDARLDSDQQSRLSCMNNCLKYVLLVAITLVHHQYLFATLSNVAAYPACAVPSPGGGAVRIVVVWPSCWSDEEPGREKLPTSHTCFAEIKLLIYTNLLDFNEKLEQLVCDVVVSMTPCFA